MSTLQDASEMSNDRNDPLANHLRQRRRHSSSLNLAESQVYLPRLIARNLPYHQSRNNMAVQSLKNHSHVYPLLIRDWFHVFLRLPTFFSLTLLLSLWTLFILIFAGIYVSIDKSNSLIDCGLGDPGTPIKWGTAFAFSLETCTTVGYGLPGATNAFFEANCPSVQVAIYGQMTLSMMFNAFLFAFFYSILSKSENRAVQLVFADKICMFTKNDQVFLKTQCYDIDSKHPVVETHVRMYVMDKDLEVRPLRLLSPNDEMGGMLLTSLPTHTTHHIDHHSALSPRGMPLVMDSHGLVLRAVDSATAGREEIECPVCGEAYGTYERLRKHIRYNRIVEERDDYPREHCHLGFEIPEIIPLNIEEIENHLETTLAEIIVVVEGIDPQVSGTFQALQSYRFEDIVWEGDFEPCMSVKDHHFVVDLKKFHQVRTTDFHQVRTTSTSGFPAALTDPDDLEQSAPSKEQEEVEANTLENSKLQSGYP